MIDILGQLPHAAGQFLFIHRPIAQASGIAVSFAEPAIVQHKHLHAQIRRFLRHAQNFLPVKVEEGGLPVVQHHRALDIAEASGNDMAVYKIMEIGGHAVDAVAGESHGCLGCYEPLPCPQFPLEAMGIDAQHHTQRVLIGFFHRRIVIAGIQQIKAHDPSLLLIRAQLLEQKGGIMPVGGCANRGIVHMDAVGNGRIQNMRFLGPAAVDGQQRVVAFRQIHHKAHELSDGQCFFSPVVQFCIAADHITVRKHRVMQEQPQAAEFGITEPKGQRFGAVRCKRQSAIAFKAALRHPVAFIHKVSGKAAIGQDALHGAMAVIALADAGIFQQLAVQIIPGGVIHRRTQGDIILDPQRLHICPGQTASVINVNGMALR